MIGKDGVFGAMQALDDKVSLNHVVTQVPGDASVIASDRLREAADGSRAFRGLLVKYDQFFLAQVQQTAACNALHSVQARTCKWLLRMHDLAGADIPLTQEFLAQMTNDGSQADKRHRGGRRTSKGGDDRLCPRTHSHSRPRHGPAAC